MCDFLEDNRKGRIAVEKVIAYCKERNVPYREATTDEQKLDIDLWIKGISVEVKTMTFNNALCIEETGSDNSNGWLQLSQAKKIIFVGNNIMYVINFSELRSFYSKASKNYSLHYNNLSRGAYGDTWTSSFKVIPLDSFKQYTGIKEIRL